MIDLDLCTALKVLHAEGVDVARSRAVDSPEDALAFADRREAHDRRFLPIVLRAASALAKGERPAFLQSESAVHAAFQKCWAEAKTVGTYVVAQSFSEHGTDVEIRGELDENDRKALSTGEGADTVRRAIPLDAASVEALAKGIRRYGHGERPHVERMLEHVLERLSHVLDRESVQSFRVVLRLHDNAYKAFDATMHATHAPAVTKRLAPRAHDRKGDDYNPSNRQ